MADSKLNIQVDKEIREEFTAFLVDLKTLNIQAARAIVAIRELRDALAALPWYARLSIALNMRKEKG